MIVTSKVEFSEQPSVISHNAVNLLHEKFPEFSARNTVTSKQKHALRAIAILLFIIGIIAPLGLLIVSFFVLNIIYLLNGFFKFYLVVNSLPGKTFEIPIVPEANYAFCEDQSEFESEKIYPIYTILVPVYREEKILPQLVLSLSALDYPKDRLDIKLILEEDDIATIAALEQLTVPDYMEKIIVPFSFPKTKPKACNYAAAFAKGEFITIYDAEDIPDRGQLKKVVEYFAKLPKNVACIQARLDFYNHDENLLTKWFSLEYRIWFAYMLPSLEKIGFSIPLGGTSNHFRASVLKELCYWDPYNVTEDADLGLRIYAANYQVRLIDSTTFEEAPIRLKNWFMQRARWIHGYMQTYLVHMRSPRKFIERAGLRGFLGLQLFIGLPCLAYLAAPVLTLLWPLIDSPILSKLAIYNLILGIILPIATCLLIKTQNRKSLLAAFTFPIYFLLHSLASYRALWQLIKLPHYWNKTNHAETKL